MKHSKINGQKYDMERTDEKQSRATPHAHVRYAHALSADMRTLSGAFACMRVFVYVNISERGYSQCACDGMMQTQVMHTDFKLSKILF